MSASDIRAGGAYIEVTADTRDVRKGMGDARRELREFGDEAKRLGTVMAGMAAAVAVGLYKATGVASDMEEIQSKFDAVFKENSEDANAWADAYSSAVNRSVKDIKEFASSVQDTFVPLGFARSDAADMSKIITRLGTDLASFNNIADDDAINSLMSAIVGNHEAVRKFGIVITEASLGAKLLEMGVKGGSQAASEQQKVMARLQLILGSTTDAQGDAYRTADSYANSTRGLKGQFTDLVVVIGNLLLPMAKEWIKTVTGWIVAAKVWIQMNPQIIEGVVKMAFWLGAAGAALVALVTTAFLIANPIIAVIALIVVAVLGILDALGLVDTGFNDLVSSIRIGGMSIKSYFEIMGISFVEAWYKAKLGFFNIVVAMEDYLMKFISGAISLFADLMEAVGMDAQGTRDFAAALEESGYWSGELADNIANTNAKLAELQKMQDDIADAEGERQSKIDQDKAKAKGKKGYNLGDLMKFDLPNIDVPGGPGKKEVPKSGVVGMFGSASLGENLGTLAGSSVEDKQLQKLGSIDQTLKKVEENTRGGLEATYA